MIDIDGMVGRLVQLMQDAHLAAGLGSCREDSVAEIIFGNDLRTAEGEQDSTWLDAFEALNVKSGVAFQCIMERSTMFGKGRRIKNDEVVLLVVGIEILEGVIAECLVTGVTREVEGDIAVGKLDGLGAAVDRVDGLRTASHGIDREASSVAEHIENRAATGILLEK